MRSGRAKRSMPADRWTGVVGRPNEPHQNKKFAADIRSRGEVESVGEIHHVYARD